MFLLCLKGVYFVSVLEFAAISICLLTDVICVDFADLLHDSTKCFLLSWHADIPGNVIECEMARFL